ncbi:hypothetical protein R6U77_15540 [Lysinibacillus louembei]|uniref:DUF2326 domain-containing protein n=1 Tax=Lysinibacillus louembei TaxID=1470088 RepID=A0ABZ0RW74_9BACI|nr:hypothetical protein [Lysinibacillus louembei]WPK11286.1 hypothetical protein R6U77_15540 [Lysinibacillus louembei]
MFIRRLILQETYPKIKPIRVISFKLGLNLIIDDSEKSGNNVGKTTVLKIIGICLGDKDKSAIYTDQETNLVNQELKNYIHTNKIEAILELSKDTYNLNNTKQEADVYLSVELFSHGKRKINSTIENMDDYYFLLLKQIMFDDNNMYPLYLDIIKKFIRVEVDSGAYKLLRFSSNKVLSNLTYRLIYNFLFNLISVENNIKLAENRINLKKNDENLNNFNKFLHKKEISDLDLEIHNQNILLKNLKKQIKNDVSDENFIYKMDKSRELKAKLSLLNQSLGTLEFQINMLKQNLDYTFQSEKDLSHEVLQNLYDETKELKINIQKTFNDLVEFNDSLVKNKIKYYQHVLETKMDDLKELKKSKRLLTREYKNLISSINEFDFDKTSTLYQNLITEQAKLLELQSFQSERNSLNILKNTNLDIINNLELEIKFNPEEADKNISIFNQYFEINTHQVLNNVYKLNYDPDISNFPLHLLASDESISNGLKKGLISIFDLSYIEFAEKINKKIPKFIIYDVIETIENDILTKLFSLANTINCQYIVAVLNEKIKGLDSVSKEDTILSLSKTNKLFKL